MLTTLLYLFSAETLQQRRTMLSEFNVAAASIATLEDTFGSAGNDALGATGRDGRSMTIQQVSTLYDSTEALRSMLATLSAPNNAIDAARNEYVGSLTNLLGQINLFEPGADGTINVAEALAAIDAANGPAVNYHQAAEAFQNSVWVSIRAAF